MWLKAVGDGLEMRLKAGDGLGMRLKTVGDG